MGTTCCLLKRFLLNDNGYVQVSFISTFRLICKPFHPAPDCFPGRRRLGQETTGFANHHHRCG